MAIKALKRMAPFWWTPEDQEGEPKTRFKIRGLNGAQQSYVFPELQIDQVARMATGMTGRGVELTLSYGLLDWDHFNDEEGPIAFSPANFERVDPGMRAKLSMAILAASYVSLEEKKT